jgi:hypothetical protein
MNSNMKKIELYHQEELSVDIMNEENGLIVDSFFIQIKEDCI